MTTVTKLFVSAAFSLSSIGPAAAVLPHEGNYTTKQMPGTVVGYLRTPAARACADGVTSGAKSRSTNRPALRLRQG